MIKLIYNLFYKELNNLVYEHNVIHRNWKDKTEVRYIDTNGIKYYQYPDFMELPVSRYEYLQGLLSVFEMGFNSKDYDLFINEFIKTVEDIVNQHTEKGKIKEITRILYLVKELETRSKIRLEPKALIELLAVVLIREDENPEIVDSKIQDMKIKQFTIDKLEHKRSFFLQAGLSTFIPALNISDSDYLTLLKHSENQINRSNEVLGTLMKQFQAELKISENQE